MITIYTDGAAIGNPGPGGYAAILLYENKKKEISGGFRLSTNNRMELVAVIKALEMLKRFDIPITIFSDSNYIVDSISKNWYNKWILNNFKGGKKNKDLWLKYAELSKNFEKINFVWVKGHSNNPNNNRCDFLATNFAKSNPTLIDEYYENNINPDIAVKRY